MEKTISNRIYKTSPLPFQGQKRKFVGPFREALKAIKRPSIIVDLFGGSGLLSHTAKSVFPDCKVVYNDYDNFCARLYNLERTNRLLNNIQEILKNYPRSAKIDQATKEKIIQRIEIEAQTGFVDYITIAANLLFSGRRAINMKELKAHTFYNKVGLTEYDFIPEEYLKGLDITRCDYWVLYEQYKDVPGVLFLVDPPYLSTDTKTYNSDNYWKLKDYLNVLNVFCRNNYFFFTSNKSNLLELCEWFSENYGIDNPVSGSTMLSRKAKPTCSGSYVDMMFYRVKKNI